jgi:hypothetical protein
VWLIGEGRVFEVGSEEDYVVMSHANGLIIMPPTPVRDRQTPDDTLDCTASKIMQGVEHKRHAHLQMQTRAAHG